MFAVIEALSFFVVFVGIPALIASVAVYEMWKHDKKYQKYAFWYFYKHLPWLV